MLQYLLDLWSLCYVTMFLFVPRSSFVAMTLYLPYLLYSIAPLFALTSPSSTIVFSFEVHIVISFFSLYSLPFALLFYFICVVTCPFISFFGGSFCNCCI
jgi:hypothetical protein